MNPVWLFVLISTVVISLVGTLAHFLYDIAHHNKVMGLFAAVNESTWEHTKIALTPMLLCGLVDGWLFGADPNYFLAKFLSLVAVIVLIPLLFYGYKALLGRDVLVLDILIFYVVILAGQGLFGWLLMVGSLGFVNQYLGCVGLFATLACYMVFTLMPVRNFLFRDPITHRYGFRAHTELGEQRTSGQHTELGEQRTSEQHTESSDQRGIKRHTGPSNQKNSKQHVHPNNQRSSK